MIADKFNCFQLCLLFGAKTVKYIKRKDEKMYSAGADRVILNYPELNVKA